MKHLFVTSTEREPLTPYRPGLLCWKSVLGGTLISVMSYMLLTALGAGLGGTIASSLVSHQKATAGLGTAAGLWLGLSAVISLFLGSYYAVRVSQYITNRVGAAHGFAVASIFFILLGCSAERIMGNLGTPLTLSTGVFSTTDSASSPLVQDSVNKTMAGSATGPSPESVSDAFADAGWTLFVTFFLGLIAAMLGGRLGSHANLERPIHKYKE